MHQKRPGHKCRAASTPLINSKRKPYLVSVNQEYRLSDGNEDRVTPTISIRELKSRYPRFVDSIHIASWEMQYPSTQPLLKFYLGESIPDIANSGRGYRNSFY